MSTLQWTCKTLTRGYLPESVRIGTLDIHGTGLLAPMAAVTDLPLRTVCEEHGVALTITEFLSAHALKAGAAKTVDKLTASLGGRAFGVQIFGREDEPMIIAAKMAVDIGASLVDINMGCPAKRVVAGACGSALMNEPELAQHIVRTVRSAVPGHIAVTVKHRAGWNGLNLNAPEFACAMVEAGAAMVTVHGRTRTQGFAGESSLDIIRKVREQVPAHIPVVGNGDVVDIPSYLRMRETTGCDAVMIGRGALGNPWLFRSIREVDRGNPDPGEPSLDERIAVFGRHVELIRELKPDAGLIHEIRKACAWYAKGLRGCNVFRKRAWTTPEPDELVELAIAYFQSLRGRFERRAA